MMASGDNLTAVIPLNVVEPFNGESNLKLIKLDWEVALVREFKLKQQQKHGHAASSMNDGSFIDTRAA